MKISWKNPKEEKGILVAFDATLQPLIFWWYQSLRKYSSLPIAFVDLGGISNKVKNWCKENGYYINCEKYVSYFKNVKKKPEKIIKEWSKIVEGNFLKIYSIRPYWFVKPIAMIHTPFEETLYLDIDCEVKDSIDPIFSCLDKNEMGLCKNAVEELLCRTESKKITFNSGVIVYKYKSEIIEKWVEMCIKKSFNFFGDQEVLSYIIEKMNFKVKILPMFWNWLKYFEDNNFVKILHWCGSTKIKLLEELNKK